MARNGSARLGHQHFYCSTVAWCALNGIGLHVQSVPWFLEGPETEIIVKWNGSRIDVLNGSKSDTEIILSIALLYVEQSPNIESYESGEVLAAG